MPSLNVNTDDAVELSRRLTKIHKSALPVVVRQTLDSVAFQTKQKDLLVSAKANFIERDSRFFKAFSKVEKAKGFNVNKMVATVGMIKTNKDATQNMSTQEWGGMIDRSLVPLDSARLSGNQSKKVKSKNRLGKLGSIPKGGRITSRKAIAGAARRAGKGNLIVTGIRKRIVYRVARISRKSFKLEALYSFIEGRKIKVKPTGFVRKAAISASSSLPRNFVKFAKAKILKSK